MTSDERSLPGGQRRKHRAPVRVQLRFERRRLAFFPWIPAIRAEFLQPLQSFREGRFEIQISHG